MLKPGQFWIREHRKSIDLSRNVILDQMFENDIPYIVNFKTKVVKKKLVN